VDARVSKAITKEYPLSHRGENRPRLGTGLAGVDGKSKEMTPDDLSTLVYRYYAYIRNGDPDPKQVEAIVQFARGLPIVATTVVQLWVRYGAEDFQAVRP
jgi:hypothetical protein